MVSAEHVERIRSVLFEYLRGLGYPEISHEKIMEELPNMWRQLEEKDLILPGMSYKAFCWCAQREKFLAALMRRMEL